MPRKPTPDGGGEEDYGAMYSRSDMNPFKFRDLLSQWRGKTVVDKGLSPTKLGLERSEIQLSSAEAKSKSSVSVMLKSERQRNIYSSGSNKAILVVSGPEDGLHGPFGPSIHCLEDHLRSYPEFFANWFQEILVPDILCRCRPRQLKKFRHLSKWCKSMVKTGRCKFGLKCNFCHHFSEFSPMRCENDGSCKDKKCWYMHSNEVKVKIGNFMRVQLRQMYAIIIGDDQENNQQRRHCKILIPGQLHQQQYYQSKAKSKDVFPRISSGPSLQMIHSCQIPPSSTLPPAVSLSSSRRSYVRNRGSVSSIDSDSSASSPSSAIFSSFASERPVSPVSTYQQP